MNRREASPKTHSALPPEKSQQRPPASIERQEVEARASQSLSSTAYLQAEFFEGPLPPPSTLAAYDQICPGAASRIIAMAEKQADHRQSLERMVVTSNCKSQDRGPILGFILAAMVLTLGGYLIFQGREVTGFVAIISALTSIVIPFVYGKREQKKELQEKRQEDRADMAHWDYSLPDEDEEADQLLNEDRSEIKTNSRR